MKKRLFVITVNLYFFILSFFTLHYPTFLYASSCKKEQKNSDILKKQIEQKWPLLSYGEPISLYIQRLGGQLSRALSDNDTNTWFFKVLQSRSSYAFAIGGGRFYITEGAIYSAYNESEVAALLAHEISHQTAGHFCQPTSRNSKVKKIGSITQRIDISKELEADKLAVNIILKAGFNPHALLSIIEKSHNSQKDKQNDIIEIRINDLKKILKEIPYIYVDDSEIFRLIKDMLSQ